MKISVILCTYNRCQGLAKALTSAAALTLPPPDEWEVLVVDNNSNDRTREVVESFCQRYPGCFRYIFEPKQGKSHALNAGLRNARGEILAFTDDDVILEPAWLQNLTASLRGNEWAGAGGRVLAQRTFALPPWLSVEESFTRGPLALFDLGPQPEDLSEAPIGSNMAFRKFVFEKYGDFRTDLGPRPGSEIRNEDSEFGSRLMKAGERLRYEPSAVVYHEIPERRLRKKYFLAWWYDKARGEIRSIGKSSGSKWCVKGIPLLQVRRMVVWTLRWLLALDPVKRFSCRIQVWVVTGRIHESYRQASATGRTIVETTTRGRQA